MTDRVNYTTDEFIAAAEQAAVEYPDTWQIFYALADKYQAVGRYADALKACQQCVSLRPKDLRSVYALATSYNLLTRAEWCESDAHRELLLEMGETVSPATAASELDKANLGIEEAALRAIAWFKFACSLSPNRNGRQSINSHLQSLYVRFPNFTTVEPEDVL